MPEDQNSTRKTLGIVINVKVVKKSCILPAIILIPVRIAIFPERKNIKRKQESSRWKDSGFFFFFFK